MAQDRVNSPDGRYIVFEIFTLRPSNNRIPEGVFKLDTTNNKVTTILFKNQPIEQNNLGTVGYLAGWSSDGKVLYLWVGTHSGSITADGASFIAVDANTGKNLLENIPLGSLVHKNWFTPSLDPNIAALITAEGGRETWMGKHLSVLNLQTKSVKVISGHDQSVVSLAFSPAGDRLVYSAGPEENNIYNGKPNDYANKSRNLMMQRHIWVTGTEGSELKQLTTDKNYRDEYPIWIADGDYILFGRIDDHDRASLWMMDADGSNQTQIVGELSPFDAFGFYGYAEWDQWFDS